MYIREPSSRALMPGRGWSEQERPVVLGRDERLAGGDECASASGVRPLSQGHDREQADDTDDDDGGFQDAGW